MPLIIWPAFNATKSGFPLPEKGRVQSFFLSCTKSPKLKKQFLFLLLCWVCCLTSYAQYRQLLHKTHAQRVALLADVYQHTLIDKDSVTIFNMINGIQQLAITGKDDDLLFETALMRAHYFYYRDKFPASLVLQVLDSLRAEAVKQKITWLEALSENMLALYNFNQLKQYQLGFEHHAKVYRLIKDLGPAAFPHKQHCLLQMGQEYYFFRDFHESLFYNLAALRAGTPPVFQKDMDELGIMNTIGLCYQQLGILDSAAYYFNKTISVAQQNNRPAWEGIASGNLGNNFFLSKQYDLAIPLLQKDVQLAIASSDWGLASGSLMVLGEIALLQDKKDDAKKYLLTAQQYVYRSGQYERLQKLYPLLSKLHGLFSQPAMAAVYLDSALYVKDSIDRKLNALQMLRAKQQVDLEQYHAEVERITSQKKINLLERNILISVVMLMMAIAVYVYREQRKRSQRQEQQIRKAREDLSDAATQLEEFARNISEKNELIEILQQHGGDHELLEQLQQSTILTDKDWEYFRRLFEKVHHGFLSRLKDKLPSLTPAEIRFMALSKLDLSNKEMAAMLGIGTDAIRQYRSRLRKKLDLSEEGSLKELVGTI